MMQGTIERNHSIDLFKLVCALLVVFIHCNYPYRHEVLPITDVAVPLFFAISGYFVYGAKRKWWRVMRILKIFVWAAMLYLLKTEAFQLLTTHRLWIPTMKNLADFVFFNDVSFSIHLWYLPAYMYVLIMAFFIDKYNAWRCAIGAIVPLLLVGCFIKYVMAVNAPHDIWYFRNAYFCGLPYFLVGALVKNFPPHWQQLMSKNKWCVGTLCCLIAGVMVARYMLTNGSYIQIALCEMNLLALTILILLLATIIVQKNDNIFSALGRHYSLYIYIFHMLIMQVCEMVAAHLPEPAGTWYMYINPFAVFVLSIAFTFLLGKLRILKL